MSHPLARLQTTLSFPSGQAVIAWLPDTLDTLLEIPVTSKPVIALIGDDPDSNQDSSRYASVIREVIVPIAQAQQVAIVESGLDQGLSQITGRALHSYRERYPYGEVAPLFGITWQGQPLSNLEPNHTQFILVPGHDPDDVRPYTLVTAEKIARGKQSVTLLFGGGNSAWHEVSSSLSALRPVIVVNGSGGTADLLAAALHGRSVEHAPVELNDIIGSEYIHIVDLDNARSHLPSLLVRLLHISPHVV